MSEKIVDLRLVRSERESAEAEEAQREESLKNEAAEEMAREAIEEQLVLIDGLRAQVAAGKIRGLVLIGRHHESGMFFNELWLRSPLVQRSELSAFVGHLHTTALEVSEEAMMAPSITADGTIYDPYADDDLFTYEDEDA